MNRQEIKYLEEVYNDCVRLERRKDLTEYGAGQGDLAAILLKKRKKIFRYLSDVEKLRCLSCEKSYWVTNKEVCVFCDSDKLVRVNSPRLKKLKENKEI